MPGHNGKAIPVDAPIPLMVLSRDDRLMTTVITFDVAEQGRAPEGTSGAGCRSDLGLDAPGRSDVPSNRREASHAFSELVALHHQRLARLAYVFCHDAQQAEDAVAEAYAKVWPKFRAGRVQDPGPYLRTAVVNAVRGGIRRRVLERREEERRRVDGRDGPSPEHIVDDRDLLETALQRLPATQRAVIVLRYYEDMTEDEIASVLHVACGTVKSRCARGLAQLRAAIGDAAVAAL
jgi:RNA polymerase sigma-70 factor (sigma-E family)